MISVSTGDFGVQKILERSLGVDKRGTELRNGEDKAFMARLGF